MKEKQRNDIFITDSIYEYLAYKDHLCSSDLKNLLKSPLHYKHGVEKEENEQTDATIIGSAVHCLILNPETFHESYFHLNKQMLPEKDKDYRSKKNKLFKDEMLLKAKQTKRAVLSDAHWEKIQGAVNAVKSHDTAMGLLKDTIRENSFYTQIPINIDDGSFVKVRIRPDALHLQNKYYISVKTTMDASPEAFGRQCYNMGYMISEAFYMRVLNRCLPPESRVIRGYFIAVENKEPYSVACYDMNENAENNEISEFLQIGDYYVDTALHRYKECEKSGKWKGYEIMSDRDDGIMPLRLPDYAKYKSSQLII